jgi:hypothetical protein
VTERHDLVAERQLLAIALSGHPTVGEKFLALPVRIWHPSTEPLATVLRDRLRRRIPVNALTVAADVAASASGDDQAERLRRFVMDCESTSPPLETWPYYVEQVLTAFTVRQAERHTQTLAQRLETATEPTDVADIVRAAVDNLTEVTGNLADKTVEPPISLAELLEEDDEPYDWIVRGLWERMDRVLLTAFEGCGKSTLLRQFALCLAAGVHPFSGDIVNREGHRVLVLDFENSRRQVKRKFREARGYLDFLRDHAALPPVDWKEMLRLEIQPQGIDLANAQEFARIEAKIAAAAPDVVIAGPLYRMSKLDIRDEQAAKTLVDALDRLRVKYQFTLILEAHVGHVGEAQGGRKLRPTGSSLFLRWPEFGFGLRGYGDAVAKEHPDIVELVAWRGSRDERNWPSLLKHGRDTLPWVVADPRYRAEVHQR